MSWTAAEKGGWRARGKKDRDQRRCGLGFGRSWVMIDIDIDPGARVHRSRVSGKIYEGTLYNTEIKVVLIVT